MNETFERGIIKWQPFNSCFNENDIINNIKKLKERKPYPTLSEDQLNLIENIIKEAYNLGLIVRITYYYDGKILEIKGQITSLNPNEHKLFVNNKNIHFKQILQIKEA